MHRVSSFKQRVDNLLSLSRIFVSRIVSLAYLVLYCHTHCVASAKTSESKQMALDEACRMLQPIDAFLLVLAKEPEVDVTGDWGVTEGSRCVACITQHTSHVTRHTSHVTRHTSHVTRHTSHVTRHTSHVTRHTSHVTRNTERQSKDFTDLVEKLSRR